MAIRIPILTSFDPKGLKQANAELGKLKGSVSSLGRNFAAAGAVIAGAGALIGRAVADAAESQKVFAQTEAVLKSMGTTANGTAQDIANLASALQKSTAFTDEAILSGANLLLTFKNIQNQAGAGNDIFDQTATLMLDVARAMGTSASGEAIRLGKALNDPVKGISALTRVGIQFTDQQKEQIKSLAQSGDLMGAQKIILAELQQQFGGSAAAYAGTFSGQLEGLNNELNDMSEEIGFMVMPALQGMIAEFRDLIPIIGPQLKAAIESVDWKALTTSVVDFTKFLVDNATAITNVIIGLFALNTAFKLVAVASGIAQTAIALKTWYLAQLTTGMTAATIAAGKLKTALVLGGVVAGVAAVITEYARLKTAIDNSRTSLSKFNTESIAVSGAVAKLNPINTLWQRITTSILGAITAQRQFNNLPAITPGRTSVLDSYAYNLQSGGGVPAPTPATAINTGAKAAASGVKKQTASISKTLKKEATIAKKEAKLMSKGISEGLASKIVGSATPIKTANKVLKKIADTGGKAATKLQNQFNKTKAGQAELAGLAAEQQAAAEQAAAEAQQAADEWARQIEQGNEAAADAAREAADQARQVAEEAARQAQEQAQEMQRIQEEARRAEEQALQERERVYESFLDSVKNTFGQIRDSIMGAFDITELGGSTNSIIRNMKKLLETTKNFSTNIQKLSAMGLNANLLSQVIQAGPMAGARLAASLVAGGAGAIGQISAGYSEFESLASGIATTGTNSRFNTAQQQNVYNINVNGGVGSGATIGKSIVDAIKAYERTSGAVWVGA